MLHWCMSGGVSSNVHPLLLMAALSSWGVSLSRMDVFPVVVDSLVGFDEVVGLPGFHTFSVNVVAVKFDSHNDLFVSPS